MSPRSPQETRRPQETPNEPQRAPGGFKVSPRRGPGELQRGPQETHNEPPEAPECRKLRETKNEPHEARRRKMSPRRPQEAQHEAQDASGGRK